MNVLFPPVLEDQAKALPAYPGNSNSMYVIEFIMPAINDYSKIHHAQVVIKDKETGGYAISQRYSPDKQTLYIPIRAGNGSIQSAFWSYNNGKCQIKIPYRFFLNGAPKVDTTYIAQVRFGTEALWVETSPGVKGEDSMYFNGAAYIDKVNETGFIVWKQKEIMKTPSGFGEWSNQQRVYFHGDFSIGLDYNLYDFVPEVNFFYKPQYKDPLDKIVVRYHFNNFTSDNVITEKVFSGQEQDDSSWSTSFKIPVAPLTWIKIEVNAVTENNTELYSVIETVPNNELNASTATNLKRVDNGEFRDWILTGEELYDGVIAKSLKISNSLALDQYITIYRVNVLTFETIKLLSTRDISKLYDFYFKDFGVEMGEQYIYVAVLKKEVNEVGSAIGLISSLREWDSRNSGYGRLMTMDAITYLSDKYHQLRIQGNVQVSSFKRNTSDNFTTTIGSKYPFYSRSGKINYRTLSLSGVITFNFDPTSTFLTNHPDHGLFWIDDGQIKNQVLILNKDLYGEENFSRTRVRMLEGEKDETIQELGNLDPSEIRGPKSIYDEYMYANTIPKTTDPKCNESVYIERKFREKVMDWLSNGKPKLFRSETEGNMIVMPSSISFSPLEKTSRIIYSVSMQLTEIADYDLENIEQYELNGTVIQTRVTRKIPFHVIDGDKVSEFVYQNLLFLDPTLDSCFAREFEEFVVNDGCADRVNQILEKITDYSFLRGLPDSEQYDKILFDDDPKFDIPLQYRIGYWENIDLWEGVRYNNSKKEDHRANVFFEVIQGRLPDNIELTPAGVLQMKAGATETGKRNDPQVLIRAKETDGGVEVGHTDFIIDVGYLYYTLQVRANLSHLPGRTLTTQDFISIPISGEFGVKFKDVSLDPNDIDYIFNVGSLPSGLRLGNYTIPGDTSGKVYYGIYGHFNDEQTEDVKITISARDARSYTRTTEINIGKVIKPLTLSKELITIGYSEVNAPNEDIDLKALVSGGSGNFSYTIQPAPIPGGMSITDDILSWTPTAASPGGKLEIVIQDTTTLDSKTILFTYGQVVPQFIFKNPIYATVSTVGNLYTLDWFGKSEVFCKIPRGYTGFRKSEIDLNTEYSTSTGTRQDVITGGLPFVEIRENPDGSTYDYKYYKYWLEQDYPNITLTENGILKGVPEVATGGKVRMNIWAEDARGVKRQTSFVYYQVYTNINPGYKDGELSFPSAILNQFTVDQPDAQAFYKIEIDQSRISGGIDTGSAQEYKIELVDNEGCSYPRYLKVDFDAATNKFIIHANPAYVDPSTGALGHYPSPKTQKTTYFFVKISDIGDPSQSVFLKLGIGRIDDVLTNPGAVNLGTQYYHENEEFRYNIGAVLMDRNLGGRGPYTLSVAKGREDDFSPYELINADKDGQSLKDFWIVGTVQDIDKTKEIPLVLTCGSDDDNTHQSQEFNVVFEKPGKTLKLDVKAWSPEDWAGGPQGMFRNDEVLIAGLSIIDIDNALVAKEGLLDYQYYFTNAGYGVDEFGNGIIWPGDPSQGNTKVVLDKNTGKISGTVSAVGLGYLLEPYFFVKDAWDATKGEYGEQSATAVYVSQVDETRHTFPKVIDQIYATFDGRQEVGTIVLNHYFCSQPLFKGSIGGAAHPYLEYYWVKSPGVEEKLTDQFHFGKGLYWNERYCTIESSRETGIKEEIAPHESITIVARIPWEKFRGTADMEVTSTLAFEGGAVAAFSWTTPEGYKIEGKADFKLPAAPVGEAQEFDLSARVSGGSPPYTFTASGNPNWYIDGGKLKRNASATPIGEETVNIQAEDDEGNIITGTLTFGGFYQPFEVDTGRWIDIPDVTGSSTSEAYLRDFGFTKDCITGGTGPFTWNFEVISGEKSLAPFFDSEASSIIVTNEDIDSVKWTWGLESFAPRQLRVTVRDTASGQTESKVINVGSITGIARYVTDSMKVPSGTKGTNFTATFTPISDYFVGGKQPDDFAFDIKDQPWGDDFPVAISRVGNEIRITGRYPDTVQEAKSGVRFVLEESGLSGSGAGDLEFYVSFGEVTGTMTYAQTRDVSTWPAGATEVEVGKFNNVDYAQVNEFHIYSMTQTVDTPVWSDENISIDKTNGVLKLTRPTGAVEQTILTLTVYAMKDSTTILDMVKDITINIGALT